MEVLTFFRDELSLMTTWKFEPIPIELDTILQDYSETDELPDAIEKFGEQFNIDLSSLNMTLYYPYETLPLLIRCLKRTKMH
jgi:hypothetical protein